MTPTLLGRWQTRLLLLATVGVLVTLPFFLGIAGPSASPIFFWVLAYIALFGIAWDALYNYLQTYRWDYDWPAILQLLAGIWEAAFLLSLVKLFGLPGVPKDLSAQWFFLHYTCVWLAVFIASQTVLRILFPRWRFKGGQWL